MAYKNGGTVTETMLVHPTTTCSSTSVATGTTLSLTTSGFANTFTVTARDAYDNIRTLNNDMTFTVDLHGSGGLPVYQGSVSSHGMTSSGVYISSYTVTAAKNYELFVKYGNDNVKSSPFTMMNRPVDTSGTKSTVTGTGLTAAAVGAKSAFTVQARDQYANARTKGASDTFVVRVVRSSAGNLPELGSNGLGNNRAMETLHSTLGTATDDGKHAGYYQVPSTGTGSSYFHTSLALNGAGDIAGLQATYYAASATTPPTTIGTDDKKGSWYSAVTTGNMPKSIGANPGQITSGDVHRVRWRGFYKATASQVHTFQTTVGDGSSRVRLWIDNQLVIDQWSSIANVAHKGPSSALTSGNYYDFCVDLFATADAHDVNVKIDKSASTFVNIADADLWNVVDVSGSPFQVTVSS